MKHQVTRFKSLAIALKELEPFIRNGKHLQSGRPFKRFNGMLSREALANWQLCAVLNAEAGKERYSFTSDPVGGDGIVHDTETDETWPTEHVMVPKTKDGEASDLEALIAKAIEHKQEKGGAAYASGKTLVVFLDAGGGAKWFPNKIARSLPKSDFAAVWVIGLHSVEEGRYVYGVTCLDVTAGDAPTWLIRLDPSFETWTVERFQ
jgi:hypothetical protein